MPRKPNTTVYRALDSFAVFEGGTPRVVRVDDLLREDDPIVATHRALLVPVNEYVEQATAAPGETRSVRIPGNQHDDESETTDDAPAPRAS